MSDLFDFRSDTMLDVLYNDAERLQEHTTKNLWMYIFNKIIFPERKYLTTTEQPPAVQHGTLRGVNIVVKQFERRILPIVLWREDMQEIKHQGYAAGLDYLISTESRDAIWVMTGFGANSRLWAFIANAPFLKPIWPRFYDHTYRNIIYLDLKGNEGVFKWIFGFIKGNPFPTAGFIEQYTSRELNGILVGADDDDNVYVEVITAQPNEFMDCRDQYGSIVRLGTLWYTSMVIYENQPQNCFHIVMNEVLYWTWNLDPIA